MKFDTQEAPERRTCPPNVARELELAGGLNRFGQPMFRVVWGYNRIIPMSGEWQEFEHKVAILADKVTGHAERREFIELKKSVVETREVPKYLPANSWHLEMWRPPEEYGSPEQWGRVGEEITGVHTIDTAGAYPYQGEYELCYPITSDMTSSGVPVPLVGSIVADICQMIRAGKERFTYLQRRAAIEQAARKKEDDFVRVTEDMLKDGLRPFAGEKFVTVPGGKQ